MPTELDSHFSCLFDEAPTTGLPLAEDLQAIYGGDWAMPENDGRGYVYSNFVISHDGRISFNEPGHFGGGDVSGSNAHDLWLMALLRARADAVMVGDNTLTLEPEHVWTHQFISPSTTVRFEALREAEGRSRFPLQVFLSLDGNIHWGASVFSCPDHHVVLATTARGASRIRSEMQAEARIDVIEQDRALVDLARLWHELREQYGIRSLLLEGGPRAYASAVEARILDDEFLTLSPIVVGNDHTRDKLRPGLFEGLAFSPDDAVRMTPLSLRRNGDYLFLRSRVHYPDET